jgi:hypothetical protein
MPNTQRGRAAITITEDRLTEIVRQAVRAEFFAAGLRIDEPEHQVDARKDFDFVRVMRERFDTVSGWVGKAIVGALLTGLLALIVAGLKAFGIKIGE